MIRQAILLGVVLLAGCAGAPPGAPPLRSVDGFELDRYLGTWYEIASYPNRFQKGCVATTATYSLRSDGQVQVVNRCRRDRLDGDLRAIEGTAWPVGEGALASRLRVRFFWPFAGDYWVIDLDPSYRWAVVGEPSRQYLWILSRTPALDAGVYASIVARLRAQGYDAGRIRPTLQPGG